MNIIEQQLLEEVLINPQSEREEVLCLEIKTNGIQGTAFTEIANAADCSEWGEKDPESEKIYHDLLGAVEDIQTVRSELSAMKQFAERLTKEWFEKNDDLPDDDTSPLAYWFAVKLQSLENDDSCLAGSALSVAVQAIKKLSNVNAEIENLEG